MKRAGIFHQGAAVWAEVTNNGETLRLPTGERIPAADAHWLAPVTPGATIFALGLNYADHVRELGSKTLDPGRHDRGRSTGLHAWPRSAADVSGLDAVGIPLDRGPAGR